MLASEGTDLQIPLRTSSTIEDYIATQEWQRAYLSGCPLHPHGGCAFRRHGSYARLTSPGVRIARWYCPEGRMTFSLLPDFLAARLPGLLATIECTVAVAASARSMEVAADALRGPEIGLAGAVRWLRRRVTAVRGSIMAVRVIAPSLAADVQACAAAADDVPMLPKLRRALPTPALSCIPAPLGFAPVALGDARAMARTSGARWVTGFRVASPGACGQHEVGPDHNPAARYAGSVKVTGSPCRPNPMSRPPPRISAAFGAPTAT
ncbi:conserved hypothetical protein [Mesorhizobium metallidurans STM 2683]|uniref:Uncharacterized protein n=1 Tax=Mesorhizobium metallidurans STM 2683 TaxID=1297569 RepID=M5EZC1_9HYPH|nr:conserved hypothetical protein [Mesorhizobium metallidurans STM 2683]